MALTPFGPLSIEVHGQVLAPRPWTLAQARWAAALALDIPAGPIAELCSGGGQIGQAAAVLSGRALVQVDVDHTACDLARRNAAHNDLTERVDVRCADIGSALRPDELFPIMLLDPPYLTTEEVGRWPGDPVTAIDGGDDGLALHRRCLVVASRHLDPHGAALLQARGARQIHELVDDIAAASLEITEVRDHDEDRAIALLRRR